MHKGIESPGDKGAGTEMPVHPTTPRSSPLCGVTAPSCHPRTQRKLQSVQLHSPPSPAFRIPPAPFGKDCLFGGYICIVMAFQTALAREARDRSCHSWGRLCQYSLPWTSDRSSLPASLSRRPPKAKPDSPWLHANGITFTLLLQK